MGGSLGGIKYFCGGGGTCATPGRPRGHAPAPGWSNDNTCMTMQAIIQSILGSGRLGPNIVHNSCYGLLLKHLKSEELHWLHPDLTVGEVEERYEKNHAEAEWR